MLALVLAGCSLPGAMPEPNEGGMGLPQQFDGETYRGDRRPISAEVEVADNGCAYLVVDGTALLAIWPRGSELSQPARLPDGTELSDGDRIEGTGTLLPFGALPGGPDGYWADVTGFCAGEASRAVVLDEVSAAR